ncbi:hypothetical protein M440DRAFT_1465681 [Trichoderma longibrachiatum ATCC 18648]|uniref:Uncharacterized protein n=1 Tax=Trichoderma longibrachiatum ATCC 18648 TaxID=983965 RepID=A0A2T4BSK8_TRILO|nr:hypothetical protein M440DRAFT_1465681 [Trichoderma longibrachiatum ATCC 18648]
MNDEYNSCVEFLVNQFSELSREFDILRSAEQQNQERLHHDYVVKVSAAFSATKALAFLIRGDLDPIDLPASMPTCLREMESAWDHAQQAALRCSDHISQYSVKIAQLHDAGLGLWQREMETLRGQLQEQLEAINQAAGDQRIALENLRKQRDVSEYALHKLQERLSFEQHKFDGFDMLSALFPPAALVFEPLKYITEALTQDMENAKRAVLLATECAVAAERHVQEHEQAAFQLIVLAEKQGNLLFQGSDMITQCTRLRSAIEESQQWVARNKSYCLEAWRITSLCVNRAEEAAFSLDKSSYAECILQIVEVALETDLLPYDMVVVEIIRELAEHDDGEQSVHRLETDKHPEGLLKLVQTRIYEKQHLIAMHPPAADTSCFPLPDCGSWQQMDPEPPCVNMIGAT